MKKTRSQSRTVAAELAELRARLAEAEETLEAIRSGAVDALVVAGPEGEQVFALKGAETPYRLLVEAMQEAALMLNPQGTILFANPGFAAMAHCGTDFPIGRPLNEFVIPEQSAEMTCWLSDVPPEGRRSEFWLRSMDRPGNPTPVQFAVRTLMLDGAPALSVVAADLTTQKAYEAMLHQSNEELENRVRARTAELSASEAQLRAALRAAEVAREELAQSNATLEQRVRERTVKLQEMIDELEYFSYTITHDLRAPLRAMQGFSCLLEDVCSGCDKEQYKEYLDLIKTSSTRMDRLITDALQYNKAGKQDMPLVTVDAAALLRGIIQSYPTMQPPRAYIRIDGPIPPVLGNEAGLTQCFANLLGNAVKFVPHGTVPEVRVWAEALAHPSGDTQSSAATADSPSVRIWIEDNGIGIPPQAQGKLFRMFQRASPDFEGTGIGLALAKKVIERLGGRIGVESVPGAGSRFWVDLRQA